MADIWKRIIETLAGELNVTEKDGALSWDAENHVAIFIDQRSDVLTVPRVVEMRVEGEVSVLRTDRDETWIVATDAIAGARIERGGREERRGQAGFSR